MSEEEVKGQESSNDKGEKSTESGDKDKFASKEDLVALSESIKEQGRKSDEVFKLLTSEQFMTRNAPPPTPPPPKPAEKTPTQDEINEMNMSQGLGFILKEVGKMIDVSNTKTQDSIKNIAASIKQVSDVAADKEVNVQIADVKKDFGESNFEKHRNAMAKIVADSPGITAKRAYLIAVGEAEPPKKAETRKGTETEKGGQEADFTETDLDPKEAGEKAYDKVFGANKKPI